MVSLETGYTTIRQTSSLTIACGRKPSGKLFPGNSYFMRFPWLQTDGNRRFVGRHPATSR